MRWTAAPLVAATVLLAAACGRSLPEEAAETVPRGGDPTGAFGGGGEGLDGTVRVAGTPAGVRLLRRAAEEFRAEEPDVVISLWPAPAPAALARLCAGKLEVAVVERPPTAAERRPCEAREGSVELRVARSRAGRPVTIVTTGRALFERFEVEALLQSVLDEADTLARGAGLQPLDVDELDETQTEFERALAGV